MYKIDAEEKMHLLNIAAYPHMKSNDARSLMNSYRNASGDILDMISSDDLNNGIDNLRKILPS